MPGYHSVKKMDSVFGKHCFKKEGGLENPTFDYTTSKKELKKKYKSDSETKKEVETSNRISKIKNFAEKFSSVAGRMGYFSRAAESQFKKTGKVAPALLKRCGSKRK
jgi:uncharacterized protein (UPF0332 family)